MCIACVVAAAKPQIRLIFDDSKMRITPKALFCRLEALICGSVINQDDLIVAIVVFEH